MITRQDVIDIANEIYLDDCIWIDDSDSKPINDLVKFAKLVEKAAREQEYEDLIHIIEANIAAEREKFCAALRQLHDSYSCASAPSSIRARGEA